MKVDIFAILVLTTTATSLLDAGVDQTEYPLGLGIGVIGAAAGAVIGWRADKAHKGSRVLFEAAKRSAN